MKSVFKHRIGPTLVMSLCGALLVVTSGCAWHSMSFWPKHKTAVATLSSTATLDDITDHINESRARLTCWRSTEVKIKADGDGIVEPTLSAKLCVQSPRNLRLTANSFLGPEVDFGSNDERFWLWVKRQEPKVTLTGSHDGQGRQELMPIPFSPSWMMEALGVIPIPTRGLSLERDESNPKQVRLTSSINDEGRATRRIMVFDLSQGQIVQHALYDDQDRLVASAEMSNFQTQDGVTLPHYIELNWPDTKTVLKLTIRKIEVNPAVPEITFKLPSYPNYRLVDLDLEGTRASVP